MKCTLNLKDIKAILKAGKFNTIKVKASSEKIEICSGFTYKNNFLWIGKDIKLVDSKDIKVEEVGEVILNSKPISMLSGREIEIDNKRLISAGRSIELNEDITEEKLEEFSNCNLVERIKINFNEFRSNLDMVYATEVSKVRPALQTIYICKDEMVALDGYRLEIRNINSEYENGNGFMIHRDVVHAIRRLPKQNGNIEIEVFKEYIKLKVNDLWIISNYIVGDFVNYKALIPTEFKTVVKLDTRELYKITKEYKKVKFTYTMLSINKNGIETSAKILGFKVKDNITANVEGEDIDIAVTNRYLEEALKQHKGNITMNFTSSISPIVITSENKLQLVLPIRIIK